MRDRSDHRRCRRRRTLDRSGYKQQEDGRRGVRRLTHTHTQTSTTAISPGPHAVQTSPSSSPPPPQVLVCDAGHSEHVTAPVATAKYPEWHGKQLARPVRPHAHTCGGSSAKHRRQVYGTCLWCKRSRVTETTGHKSTRRCASKSAKRARLIRAIAGTTYDPRGRPIEAVTNHRRHTLAPGEHPTNSKPCMSGA